MPPTAPVRASSRAFLARARAHLHEGAVDSLLCAALNLRLGIEARLHEYLDAAEQVSALKKRGWQVSRLAKDIERVFSVKGKIATVTVLRDDGSPLRTLLYTPVSSRARAIVERLGDYLHFTPRFRPRDQAWQTALTELVNEGVGELAAATTGTLLGPPMLDGATGQGSILAEILEGEDFEAQRTLLGEPGQTVTFKVDYLENIPDGQPGVQESGTGAIVGNRRESTNDVR